MKKGNKGITLIALIITIIVMLLLSVVSINIMQNAGIIEKVKLTKEEHRASTIQEQKELFEKEIEISKYEGNTPKTINDLLNKLEEEKLITEEEKKTIMQTGRITIGSKEIVFSEDAILPDGYTRCEYLESTGTQWIDLNLYATDVGSWELECAFTKIPTTNDFEGNGAFGNANNRFDIGVYANKFWLAIGTPNNTITADYNKHYFKLDRINERAYLDSTILSFSSVNWLTQTKKMRLFGRTYYLGKIDDKYCASMKCYSNKMYDNNNNLIINLIPCLDNNGVPCMYDTVSGKTFYNQGTGEFIAGSIVE